MSDQEIKFLSREQAVQIVGAIQEEEDIHQPDRRILTVYTHDNKEICWFDFEELMEEVADVPKGEKKEAVQEFILTHLPDWALDM